MPTLHHALALVLLLVPLAPSPNGDQGDKQANDPSSCPYCHNDPALMEKAGIVSHGGFEFGKDDTGKIDHLLATCDIRWIESKHFELGFAIGAQKVKQDEKDALRAELAKLAQVLPAVDPRVKALDPWLRAHLYAQRMEEIWNRFVELMKIDEASFPPPGSKGYTLKGKYMGEGPYLGMRGKFEVLILPSEASHVFYLKDQFGLLVKQTQRWNMIDRDSLSVTIHTEQGGLRDDQALHGHLAFNLTINMLDGFKHYSYDTQIWLREGLAHFVEREINPKFNSFDSSEGAIADKTSLSEWEPEVKKLVKMAEAPRMAELVALKDYSELKLPHHYTSWSMVDYLVKTDPDGFACLNDALHGLVNKDGFADGSNLPEVHRDAFKRCLGKSYAEFDAAWSAWVVANYSAKASDKGLPPFVR